MKRPTNFFIAVILGLVMHAGGEETPSEMASALKKLEVTEVADGSSPWIMYGPGIINSVKSAFFSKIVREKDGSGSELVEVDKAKIPEFRKWCRKMIEPRLGTQPTRFYALAGSDVYNMACYAGENLEDETALFFVPLGFYFNNFGDKEYDTLVKYWCTTNQVKREIEPFINKPAPMNVTAVTNAIPTQPVSPSGLNPTNQPAGASNQPPPEVRSGSKP